MKSTVFAVLLLTVIIIIMTAISQSVHKNADVLLLEIKSLPDTPESDTPSKITDIEKTWNDKKTLFADIVKYDYVYNIDKDFKSALSGCLADDPGTYLAAKNGLITTLEYLKNIQTLKLGYIF